MDRSVASGDRNNLRRCTRMDPRSDGDELVLVVAVD